MPLADKADKAGEAKTREPGDLPSPWSSASALTVFVQAARWARE
jgi:hypothetical protein